ncbi:MAG: prolyl oligopeptidase family serine peptidase, partial [Planctomycetaceae bacterium]|nr:prolyl oligopeptidase family serine peptidase [Planctomycetaceae bacterium]
AFRDLTPGFERDFVSRQITFWTSELFLRRDGKLVKIDKPDDANASVHREWLLVELRSPWTVGGTTHPAGSLLAADFERFLAGDRTLHVLFAPGPRTSLVAFAGTRNRLLLTTLDNVRSRIEVLSFADGAWQREPLPGVPDAGTASASPVDDIESDDYLLVTSSPLTPSTLALGTAGVGREPERLKASPTFFETTGLRVEQHEAVSKDGTRIPYFQIGKHPLPADASTPTLLYGYGGFEIPLVPGYDPVSGAAWLEKGHVLVIANIRGGGEFGPAWHQAALKEKRPRAYEDFAAVAEDLIRRRVTSTPHLGIKGGSNGGLLVGNMYARRPDLFGAVVCQVPLRPGPRLSAAADHDEHPRRPRPSRPCPQDDGPAREPRQGRALLREHRGGPRRRRRQQTEGLHGRARLDVPGAETRPARQMRPCAGSGLCPSGRGRSTTAPARGGPRADGVS